MDILEPALRWGGEAAANVCDADGRAALHYAAALNQSGIVKRLLEAGADPDIQDREGYTPLHMATGYLHVDSAKALLTAGADARRSDRQGRDVHGLLDMLRGRMASATMIKQRMRLEEVAKALVYSEYEDVAPAAVLAKRSGVGGAEYLVAWRDGADDSWVAETQMSPEVIADFEGGWQYAESTAILDSRGRGDAREYLVRWADGAADSWESEDNVARCLITDFEAARRGAGAADRHGGAGTAAGGSGGVVEGEVGTQAPQVAVTA